MKKILITIMGIIGFLCLTTYEANAAAYKYHGYVYEGDKIDNIYYKNKDNTLKEAHIYKINESNKIIYSIEYDNETPGAKRDDYDDTPDYRKTKLTQKQAQKMNLIGYYGYNYQDELYNHTDIKWYAITQYLIWQEETDNNLAGIVDENGNDIFADEIAEMQKILKDHYIKPNFGSNKFKVKAYDEITIEDQNHVLDKYEIYEPFGLQYQIEDNKIVATSSKNSSFSIHFDKKDKRYSRSSVFYVSSEYRDAIEIGSYEEISTYVTLSFVSGQVFINKLGEQLLGFEDDHFIYKYEQAKGTVYHLFAKKDIYNNVGNLLYHQDELVSKIIIGENSSFDNLYLSDYYAKEISNPYAYHITGNPYNVSLNLDRTAQSVTFKSPYQKAIIRFSTLKQEPSFENGKIKYNLYPHANIEFGLYANQDIYSDIDQEKPIVTKDTLIGVATSDSSGSVKFDINIPLGKYYIAKLTPDELHHSKEERLAFTFALDPTVDRQYYNLKNFYSYINTQKITFKGDGNLKIFDQGQNLIMEGEVKDELDLSLPYGKYYYQANAKEMHPLTINESNDKIIILDEANQEKEDSILDNPIGPLIPMGGNSSKPHDEETKNEITMDVFSPPGDVPSDNKDTEEEKNPNDNLETEVPEQNKTDDAQNDKEVINEEEKEEQAADEKEENKETVEKEENQMPNTSDEEVLDNSHNEEILEDKKEELDKPIETDSKEEKEEKIPNNESDIPKQEETIENKTEEPLLPKDEVDENINQETPDKIEDEKQEEIIIDNEKNNSLETDNKNEQSNKNDNEEDQPEENLIDKKDDNEEENIPTNDENLPDESEKIPEDNLDDILVNETSKDEINTNDNKKNENTEKKDLDMSKDNFSNDPNISVINKNNENYEELNVDVPATDQYDFSLYIYLLILLISSITFIYVKE